jgi:prepilin signal peptidase PulO-like enzyme (type II secretory pathway)
VTVKLRQLLMTGLAACVAWLGLCLFTQAYAEPARKPSGFRDIDYSMTPEEARTVRTLEAVTALWFLSIGCCVGSFLNVVVYREPLGLDIVLPKSRCPKCQSAIVPGDNIPVFGWLRLRGKCRSCQLPISARYPLVELAVGILFLAFMYRTLLSGGANLPVREINTYKGVVWILWYTKWDLVRVFLFHMVLLVSLWTAALMEYDGHGWPRRMQWFAVAVGVVGLAIWPQLHSLPLGKLEPYRNPPLWTGPIAALAGIAVATIGWGIAALLRWRPMPPSPLETPEDGSAPEPSAVPHPGRQFAIASGLIGLFLGWQTGLVITLATGLFLAIHPWLRRHALAWTAAFTTSVLWFWRPLYQLSLGLFSS